MSTIAQLAVSLELNAAKFNDSIKSAAATTDAAMKRMQGAVSDFKSGLISLTASVVSVAAVMKTLKSAVDFGDELQTTSERLGMTVKEVQSLSLVAAQSGTNVEQFGKAFKGLADAMVKAQDSGSKQAQLFQSLGVSTKDASGNLRSAGDVAKDVAKALDSVGSETTRLAAGTALFGRSYLEVAGALRTYKESQEAANEIMAQFGTVSAAAAKSADNLSDRLKLIGGGAQAAVLQGLTSGLVAVESALRSLQPVIATLSEAFGDLFGWIGEKLAVALINIADLFQKVATSIAAVVASVATLSFQPLRDLQGEIAKLEAQRQGALGRARADARFPGLDDSDQVSRAAAAGQRLEDRTRAVTSALADQKQATVDLLKAVQDFIAGLEKENSALNAQLASLQTYGVELTNAKEVAAQYELTHGKLAEEMALLATAFPMAAAALQAYVLAQARSNDQLQTAIRLERDYLAAVKQHNADMAKDVQNLTDEIAKERDRADAIGKTREEIVDLAIARETANEAQLRSIEGADMEAKKSELLIAKLRELKGAIGMTDARQAAYEGWSNFFKDIGQMAQDFFADFLEHGSSAFKNLWENFKHWAIEAIAKIAAQQLVVSLGLSVGGLGASAAANAASAAGGIGGIGGLGSLFNFGQWGQNLSAFGANLGILASGGGLESIGGLAGLGSSLASIAGPIAAVAAVGMAIKSFLDSKKGGPKTGGFSETGINDYTGQEMYAGRYFTPNQQDAQVKAAVEANMQAYEQFAKLLGAKAAQVGFAQGFDTDPLGKAPNRIHTSATVGGKSVYDVALGDLGRDSQVLADRIVLENKRALIAALQATDLPGILGKLFQGIDAKTITGDAADNLLGFATAYKQLADVFNSDPLDDALNAIADAAGGAQRALEKQGDALLDLLDTYDGTAASTQALATATQDYYNNVVAMIAQIEQAKTAIANMFAASIKQYQFSKLDTGGKYSYLQKEIDASYAELRSSSSATRIQELAKLIDSDMREAFGLLTPEQQAQMADQFIKGAQDVNKEAADRLDKVKQDQIDTLNSILTAIQTAANDFITAAADVKSGGADILTASETPVQIDVNVNVDGGTAEVGGGS